MGEIKTSWAPVSTLVIINFYANCSGHHAHAPKHSSSHTPYYSERSASEAIPELKKRVLYGFFTIASKHRSCLIATVSQAPSPAPRMSNKVSYLHEER